LRRIAELVHKIPAGERRQHFAERAGMLNEWHRVAAEFMPQLLESSAPSGEERSNK